MRAAIGLPRAPDYNTLCRAFGRLVKSKSMNGALDVQAAQAGAMGWDIAAEDAKPSAMDSTCFESRRDETAMKAVPVPALTKPAASRSRSKTMKAMPKLSIAVAYSCHLILVARASVGMGSDHPHFAPLLFAAWCRAEVRVMTADAGYDSRGKGVTTGIGFPRGKGVTTGIGFQY